MLVKSEFWEQILRRTNSKEVRHSQCPRLDLNKKSQPQLKTTTALLGIPFESKISVN